MTSFSLRPSGYDCHFVSQVSDDYICNICGLPLRTPVQTKCGHRFCKDCLHESYQQCPVDGEDLDQQEVFDDKATERKMMSFQVRCANQGCGWQGQLKYIQVHNDQCLLTIVPCSYKSFGCDFKGQRIYLSEHIVAKHLAFTTEILLTLQDENANLKKQVEDLKQQHSTMTKHITSLTDENVTLKKHVALMNTPHMTKEDQSRLSYIFKVEDFSKQLQIAKQEDCFVRLYSEPFYTHRYGYKLKLEVNPNGCKAGKGTHLSVFLHVLRGEYDGILTWPLDWKIRFILLDQKSSQRKNIKMSFPRKSADYNNFKRPTTNQNTGRGLATFVSHETLSTEKYLADGTLFLQLELEKSSK